MDPSRTDRTTYPNGIEQDKVDLIEAKNEETVDPPEKKISDEDINIQEHKANEDYNSLTSVYCLGKGQCDIKNLNVDDIKEKKTLCGNTALHVAARYGINEVVKNIAELDIQWSFSSVNSNRDKAYHVAARAGQISTLQTLLAIYVQHFHDIGADERLSVDMLTDPNDQGNTIFHEALINGGQKGAVIFEALASPVKIKAREGDKSFSLESDVYGEEVAFLENNEGVTPLYLAIEFGYKQIVERLLKNCKGYPKQSPIITAIIKQDSEILDIILSNKAEWIHIKDDKGWLPLHFAAYFGYLDGVCRLLNKCTSCTLIKEKEFGFFPLHLASYKADVEVFKKLLNYCLDPCEMLDNEGQNVLHTAAKYGNHNVVSYILQVPELENIINQKDKDGNTPLHLAARYFRARVVHTLTWDKRVDLTLINNKKQTARYVVLCKMKGYPIAEEHLTWLALASAKAPHWHSQMFVNRTDRSNKVPAQSEEASLEGKSQYQGSNIEPTMVKIETLILVSTLIVTVSFAAGIQFPGGISDKDGQAKLLDKGMFQLYIICITISMYGAIVASIMFFLGRLGDFTRDFAMQNLAIYIGIPFLGVTLTTLSVAFLAAIYLVISKLTWLVTILLLMSIIFIFVVLSVYMVISLPPFLLTIPFVRNISYYPFQLVAWLLELIGNGTTIT